MSGKTFLFTMWDGGGNVPPVMGIARRLVGRGHRVHILGDPTLEAEATHAGASLIPWREAPHRKSRRPEDDPIKDYDIKNPLAMIRAYVEGFIGRPARAWAGETLAALEATGADMLFGDLSIPASLIAGEKAGLPTVSFCPNIWMLPTPGIPPLGPGFAPARGPLGRARDAAFRALSHRAFGVATPYLNEVRSAWGLPPVKNVSEQATRAAEVHVFTSPRFDFTSPALPANVRYTGPILDDPDWCESWTSPWEPGDSRPLVLVGLSSTFQRQAEVLRRIVDALRTLPVRALLTVGPAIDPAEVPAAGNVVVVRTAPHSQVLRHASALVTHCGHGTTMRGLSARVPLVCIPMGRDQNDTAARVVHHGAGVRVKPGAPARRIRAAIEAVLGDPAYREGARRLGDAIESREGCVDVIESLERLASSQRPRAAA